MTGPAVFSRKSLANFDAKRIPHCRCIFDFRIELPEVYTQSRKVDITLVILANETVQHDIVQQCWRNLYDLTQRHVLKFFYQLQFPC